ncbi:hypothetical protein Pst134EA_032003 [Puccinia striiformis f. sp. tritici]|uniref:uncharacterized protein n=1 Tax=Puccinia striiformis f. sp. tritici TaxID=168172 RepID=UPI002007A7A1|nr:uncharacterized protein Pst134EA_032003 [Puccinia striiformis f. sp. tritici]KAH9441959.1 hypothetical protein Pst134EA_032003 [Puccinia striiformis f. sp. tritici]
MIHDLHADKLAYNSDELRPQSPTQSPPPNYLQPSQASQQRQRRRHTTGRITFIDQPTSERKDSDTSVRPKSLQCISEQADIVQSRRPSFHLARNPEIARELVILLADSNEVTDEATLFPLEDDPTELAMTFRSTLTGIIMGIIGSAVGLVTFIFKPVMVYLAPVFLQIMCMFLGRALALIPGGPKWWNPGPFSLKETVHSSIIAMAARNVAYSIIMLATEDLYFDQKSSALRSIGILLSTQMVGYGWGGVSYCQESRVYSFRIFDRHLISLNVSVTALLPRYWFTHPLQSFHIYFHRRPSSIAYPGRGSTPRNRSRSLIKVFAGIGLYEIIPTYLMPALQGVSFPCLALPASTLITSLFGGVAPFEGLGFFELSFDWNIVGAGSPLAMPLFAQALQLVSVVITAFMFWPAYRYSWFGFGQKEEFPFLSVSLFRENGTLYPIKLITQDDTQLNEDQLGLPIYTSTNVLTQIFQTLAVSSSITHILLWQWPLILRAFKGASNNDKQKDPHRILVEASYPDLPFWVWYACLGVATTWALSMCYREDIITPYSLLISVGLSGILTLSMGFICAISGYTLPLNGVCQMIGGLLFRGNVMGNMWFSNYSSATTSQALSAMSEMKIGQYAHMPPIAVAAAQATGMFVGVIVNYFVLQGLLNSQREALLLPNGNGVYSGTIVQNYGASAIAWGKFSHQLYAWGGRYFSVPLALGYGLCLPVPFYLIHKLWPHQHIKDFNIPLVCGFVALSSLGVSAGRTMNILVGLASQLWARRYYPAW